MTTNHRCKPTAIHRLPQLGQILRWRNFIILGSSNHSPFCVPPPFINSPRHSHSISNLCHWAALSPLAQPKLRGRCVPISIVPSLVLDQTNFCLIAAGKMENNPFALNVNAGEVSCRAGTIKCSRRHAPQAPSVPQRETEVSVSPLIAPGCGHLADKLPSSLNIQQHKSRSAWLQNASQPVVLISHVRCRY